MIAGRLVLVCVVIRHISTKLIAHLTKNGEFGGVACDAISFSWGKSDVDPAQSRTVAAHCYLFQYEMPETILVLTASKFHIIAGPKKSMLACITMHCSILTI